MDVNVKNTRGDTALLYAAHNGHTDIVKDLIAKRADVNVKNAWGNTALIWAAQNGHTDIVEALIAEGANVNVKNESGYTALTKALERKHTESVEALLGAEVDIKQIEVNGVKIDLDKWSQQQEHQCFELYLDSLRLITKLSKLGFGPNDSKLKDYIKTLRDDSRKFFKKGNKEELNNFIKELDAKIQIQESQEMKAVRQEISRLQGLVGSSFFKTSTESKLASIIEACQAVSLETREFIYTSNTNVKTAFAIHRIGGFYGSTKSTNTMIKIALEQKKKAASQGDKSQEDEPKATSPKSNNR